MKITALLAQHIIDVHEGGNWTEVDIAETVKDVTWQEATMHTKASPNTIASLLHHISFWNRVEVQRAHGIEPEINEANGYDHPPVHNEEDWQHLIADNTKSAHELADVIRTFEEAKLSEPLAARNSTAYKEFAGAAEHTHYHLGQMVILKKLIRAGG